MMSDATKILSTLDNLCYRRRVLVLERFSLWLVQTAISQRIMGVEETFTDYNTR